MGEPRYLDVLARRQRNMVAGGIVPVGLLFLDNFQSLYLAENVTDFAYNYHRVTRDSCW